MQGRESKHQQLASLASFSLVKHRWAKVFRHDHMSNIWIRQQNPFHDTYKECRHICSKVVQHCRLLFMWYVFEPCRCMHVLLMWNFKRNYCLWFSRENDSKVEKNFSWSSKMKISVKLSWIPSDWGCSKVVARELDTEIIRGLSEESLFVTTNVFMFIFNNKSYNVLVSFIKITFHVDLKCYYFVLYIPLKEKIHLLFW